MFMSPLHVVDVRSEGGHGGQGVTHRLVALRLVVRVGLHVLRSGQDVSEQNREQVAERRTGTEPDWLAVQD